MVAGLEIMFDAGRLKGDVTSPAFPASDVWHSRIDGFVTTTSRFGYSFGMWMPYVKAGWEWGRVTSSAGCLGCIPAEFWKNTQWQNGGTIGAGIEAMLGGNWIIGIEYDYIDLSSKHHGGFTTPSGFRVDADETARINMILGRLSYLFGSH